MLEDLEKCEGISNIATGNMVHLVHQFVTLVNLMPTSDQQYVINLWVTGYDYAKYVITSLHQSLSYYLII